MVFARLCCIAETRASLASLLSCPTIASICACSRCAWTTELLLALSSATRLFRIARYLISSFLRSCIYSRSLFSCRTGGNLFQAQLASIFSSERTERAEKLPINQCQKSPTLFFFL